MIELKRKFFLNLLIISVAIRSVYLTSFLIYLSLRQIKDINYGKINKTFLVLVKSIGVDDLKISFQNKKSNINFYQLDRKITKIIFRSFVKKAVYKDYDYNSKNPQTNSQLKNLQLFLHKVFKTLKIFKNYNAIINFNVFYYGDVELQKVSNKLGVKFFSIHKEALKPPLYLKYFKWIYKNTANKFYGTKILTYNNFEKKLLVDGKIASKNKIKVIGMPRLTKSFEIAKKNNINKIKKIIVYSSLFRKLPYFKNPYYVRPKHKIFDHKSDLDFFKIQEKTLNLLSIFLDKNKEARVTVKVRVGHEKLFEKKNIHKRMDIVKGGSGHELLKNHDIVIAFNSTIILEALAANKIVFCPFQNIKSDELFKFTKLAICSNSKKIILNKLQNIYDNRLKAKVFNQKTILRTLKSYLNNNDGKAGERLFNIIDN